MNICERDYMYITLLVSSKSLKEWAHPSALHVYFNGSTQHKNDYITH